MTKKPHDILDFEFDDIFDKSSEEIFCDSINRSKHDSDTIKYHYCYNHKSPVAMQSEKKHLEFWFYCTVCGNDLEPLHTPLAKDDDGFPYK